MLEVPPALLEARAEAGADRWDEMWDGELHMVPPPFDQHQDVAIRLLLILAPLADARGLLARYETGLFRPGVDNDYRVPDQVYAHPSCRTERGIEGPAALVVEIRSPHDETYRKLDWYASLGVEEVLVVEPATRTFELFTRQGDRMVLVDPGDGVTIRCLGVKVETVNGRIRLTWADGAADV